MYLDSRSWAFAIAMGWTHVMSLVTHVGCHWSSTSRRLQFSLPWFNQWENTVYSSKIHVRNVCMDIHNWGVGRDRQKIMCGGKEAHHFMQNWAGIKLIETDRCSHPWRGHPSPLPLNPCKSICCKASGEHLIWGSLHLAPLTPPSLNWWNGSWWCKSMPLVKVTGCHSPAVVHNTQHSPRQLLCLCYYIWFVLFPSPMLWFTCFAFSSKQSSSDQWWCTLFMMDKNKFHYRPGIVNDVVVFVEREYIKEVIF